MSKNSTGSQKLSLSTQLSLAAANTIARVIGEYEVKRDIRFDAAHQLDLDWYRPRQASPETPVLIFFYGGGWMSGDKSQFVFVAQAFAERGYQVVIPNYRLYPQVQFPDFLRDAAKAVAYVQQQAQTNTPKHTSPPIFLMGHSAGGYIAAMLAVDAQYLAAEQLTPSIIKGVAGLAGAYSFDPAVTDYLPVFANLQNTPQGFAPMQVDTRVQGQAPPMLLITGGKDTTVKQSNTDKLASALQKIYSPVKTKIYPDLNHTGLVSVIAKPLRFRASVVEDVDQFFQIGK